MNASEATTGRRLLEVDDLDVTYGVGGGVVRANRDVSLALQADEIVGVIGESGSGKTTLGHAILRLLPSNAEASGKTVFDGVDLMALSDREFHRYRWRELAYIPQNALSALDPAVKVGRQIIDPMLMHGIAKDEAIDRMRDTLELVGLKAGHARSYPHQLSGGMRQRICIAAALVMRPRIVVADEPTTALDVLVQKEIIDLMQDLRQSQCLTVLYITHDLGVASALCDRLAVMYRGEIVESGPTQTLLTRAAHPYTMSLVASYPRGLLALPKSIPGNPPQATLDFAGCGFADRCAFAASDCAADHPELTAVASSSQVARCLYVDRRDEFRAAITEDRDKHALGGVER